MQVQYDSCGFLWKLVVTLALGAISCKKATTAPPIYGVAGVTVVNAIPNSVNIIPVVNTSIPILYFNSPYTISIGYGGFNEYSVAAGHDTVYAVQDNADTINIGPKGAGSLFYNILQLTNGGIYSLFLCGNDTSSPDFVFTVDSLPSHNVTDSSIGIRFINLSAGSNPVSINIEGSSNGPEISTLSYKGLTRFKNYLATSNSPSEYTFDFRDAVSDSLVCSFTLVGIVNGTGGNTDPNNYRFRNVTIALIGQPGSNAIVPQSAMLINNY